MDQGQVEQSQERAGQGERGRGKSKGGWGMDKAGEGGAWQGGTGTIQKHVFISMMSFDVK